SCVPMMPMMPHMNLQLLNDGRGRVNGQPERSYAFFRFLVLLPFAETLGPAGVSLLTPAGRRQGVTDHRLAGGSQRHAAAAATWLREDKVALTFIPHLGGQ
ncbi:hypothetical protein, partial [Azospirillum aestuarii]|uniref:hypothetical protein n=1 Tax=Azospirillum aestuarii TaxID=2802052 RepID=UPI004054E97D